MPTPPVAQQPFKETRLNCSDHLLLVGTTAVICTTLTFVFAFFPLLLMPGTAGQFITSLTLSVIYTVLASMIVALTIMPLLAKYFLGGTGRHEANWALRTLQKVISASYRPVLHFCMRHRALSLLSAGIMVAGGFALVPGIGFSLFPKTGLPQFLVQIADRQLRSHRPGCQFGNGKRSASD